MKLNISDEKSFSILKNSFMIGPSTSGYTLQYSATGNDGEWTSYKDATPANTNVVVSNVPEEVYFRLSGNSGSVVIRY